MTKKSLFFAFCFLLFAFLSGCSIGLNNRPSYPNQTPTPNRCYQLEPGVTAQINPTSLLNPDCQNQFAGKTYIRLRQNVRIIDSKIAEGQATHPHGDCQDSYSGSLREIGQTTNGQRVFWESENHLHDNLKDFILVLIKQEKGYHHFDVYLDQTLQENIPEFVKNCQETGGLIPVMDSPQATFPPQFFAKADIDPAGFETNFAEVEGELQNFYVKIQELENLPPGNKQIGRFLHTIEGESRVYDVFYHAGSAYLLGPGNQDGPYLYNPAETPPSLTTNPQNPTLQLATFEFISTAEWTWATPECKPVLYLYPEKPTKLTLKLNPAGRLTLTDPPYDSQKGWKVIAYPNGTLSVVAQLAGPQADQGRPPQTYPYLYYEALIEKFKTPQTGWVVKKENLPGFFKDILPQLGLNEKEAADFKDYWLGRLVDSSYFLATLLSQEEIERIEPIEFSTPPDTFIRVRFYFKGLKDLTPIKPPTLPPPPVRKGFTAVEWGGLYKN